MPRECTVTVACSIPSDTMTEKEKRELKDGRYKVADTLEDCANGEHGMNLH